MTSLSKYQLAGIALYLYLVSLALPALGDADSPPYIGVAVLLTGWMGVLLNEYRWFANPFFIVALIGLSMPRVTPAWVKGTAFVGLVLALSSLLPISLPGCDEASICKVPAERLAGAYIWMAAYLVLYAGALSGERCKLHPAIGRIASKAASRVGIFLILLLSTAFVLHAHSGTFLWWASEKGDIRQVRLLLALGTDPSARQFPRGDSALHHAVSFGNSAIAILLMNEGADPESRGRNLKTPLHVVKDSEVADTLLSHGALVDSLGDRGETSLQAVAGRDITYNGPSFMLHGQADKNRVLAGLKIAETLIAHGADVNKPALDGATPLHVAAKVGNVPMARLLLDHGANPNAPGTETGRDAIFSYSPLGYAVSLRGSTEMTELLLSRGARLDGFASDAPLLTAASSDNSDGIKLLLARGANPNCIVKKTMQTALFLVAARGDRAAEVIEVLLKSGARPNDLDIYGRTALHTAASVNAVRVISLLLAKGADIDAGASGWTALHYALLYKKDANKEAVALLLERGANPNARTDRGETPLSLAKGAAGVTELLVKYGAR